MRLVFCPGEAYSYYARAWLPTPSGEGRWHELGYTKANRELLIDGPRRLFAAWRSELCRNKLTFEPGPDGIYYLRAVFSSVDGSVTVEKFDLNWTGYNREVLVDGPERRFAVWNPALARQPVAPFAIDTQYYIEASLSVEEQPARRFVLNETGYEQVKLGVGTSDRFAVWNPTNDLRIWLVPEILTNLDSPEPLDIGGGTCP